LIIFALAAVLFVTILGWRMRRMMTATPFNPYRAWVIPLLFIVLLALSISHAMPLPPLNWVWIVLAGVVGAGFGWLRGKSITMIYDAAKGQLFARGGAMAMLFIVALIVARSGFIYYLHQNGASLRISAPAADAIFAALGAGLFIARSAEMGLRGHNMLIANRNAPSAPAVIDVP